MFRLRSVVMAACLAGAIPSVAAPISPKPPETPPLFHGNWCGRGDAHRASPVDALDAACRAHDLCYEQVGRNACACDKAFLRATADLVKSRRVPEPVRGKAATANSFFSVLPCAERGQMPGRAGTR